MDSESDDDRPAGADSSRMTEKETQKVQDNLWKAGYRDGVEEGRKEGLQKNFDKGYQLSFEHSIKIGQLRGMIDALIFKDATLTKFLSPLVERMNKEAEDLQSFEFPADKTPEEAEAILREKWESNLADLKEQFVRLFPYGEEEAQKILDSATKLSPFQ